jgi:hypothetical protein
MRIIANKIVTKWEIEAERVPSEPWIRMELCQALGQKLNELQPLYFKNKIEGDVEHRIEVFVFSKNTFDTIMGQLRGILSEGEFERVKNTFMNTI